MLSFSPLLLVSVGFACVGTYVALTLWAQTRWLPGVWQGVWRGVAATTTALSVWMMHFLGLLDSDLTGVTYDPGRTALSLFAALAGTLLAFELLGRARDRTGLLLGGLAFGVGVSAMHALGLTALTGAQAAFPPGWALASLLTAAVYGTLALWTLHFEYGPGLLNRRRALKAAGLGVLGWTLYRGVTTRVEFASLPTTDQSPIGEGLLATLLAAAGLFVFGLLLLGGWVNTRLREQDHRQAELLNRAALDEQRSWTVVNTLTEGVLILDARGRPTQLNDSARQLLGLSGVPLATAVRRLGGHGPALQFCDDQGRPLARDRMPGTQAIAQRQRVPAQVVQARLPGDEVRWLLANAAPLPAAEGEEPGAVVSLTDITVARAHEAALERRANQDELTGLLGRQRFQELFEQARQHPGPLSLVYADLDHFKDINDTLGHATGDELLRQVAARLRAALPSGAQAARFGGDEFALLVPGGQHSAEALIRALRQTLQTPFAVGDRELHVDMSVGYSVAPEDGDSFQTLLQNADLALNRVKAQGRGGELRYSPSHALQRTREVELTRDLRRALQPGEGGQLSVAYQPLVRLVDEGLSGCEALVRWRHPQLGSLSPAEFVPIAEQSGLIVPLGEWVLREACAQAARWQRSGTPLPVAVNISMRQFAGGGLPALIHSVLHEARLPPELLTLEVTESVLMNQSDDVGGQLARLRGLGCMVALDDFGTGYSSLQVLHELPLDRVKLDRGFLNRVQGQRRELLLKNVITLAHDLGLSVVAEGVETSEEAALLRRLGCRYAQGYHYGRPQPAALLSERLRLGQRGP